MRTDGPQTHLVKSGTPTMGGVLILIAIGITTLLWGDLTNKYVWTVLVVTLGYGIVGWYDDWKKVVYRDPNGLASRWKFFWQSVLGIGAALFLAFSAKSPAQTELIMPFIKTRGLPAGHRRLHHADLLRDRRHQQCGEPDRWPGRPGDHADRDDRRRLRV